MRLMIEAGAGELQILRPETRAIGNPGHHPRANLLLIMEGEHVIRPAFS
jgi:hypothetical protein